MRRGGTSIPQPGHSPRSRIPQRGCRDRDGGFDVPPRRINVIVLGKRAITADTGPSAGALFQDVRWIFLGLQTDYELMQRRRQIGDKLKGDQAKGGLTHPASAAKIRAQLRVPLWNEVRSNFSFGECTGRHRARSPTMIVSMPRMRLKSPTIRDRAALPDRQRLLAPFGGERGARLGKRRIVETAARSRGSAGEARELDLASAGSRRAHEGVKGRADLLRVLRRRRGGRRPSPSPARGSPSSPLPGIAADYAVDLGGRAGGDLLDQACGPSRPPAP